MELSSLLAASGAEEAVHEARGLPDGVEVAIDGALLTAFGAPLVAALDEVGAVMVLAPMSGEPATIAAAVGTLVRCGASWVTLAAPADREVVAAALDATSRSRCRIAVTSLRRDLTDADLGPLLGTSRGKFVSRVASEAAAAGAHAIVCGVRDIGVVAQSASTLGCIVVVDDAVEAGEVAARGGLVAVAAPGSDLVGIVAAARGEEGR